MTTPLSISDAMIALREMYQSAINAGFNEDQAMRIVLTYIENGKAE